MKAIQTKILTTITLLATLTLGLSSCASNHPTQMEASAPAQAAPKDNYETRRTFYPDGSLQKTEEILNGEKHGVTRIYNRHGYLIKSSQWEKGQRQGTTLQFSDDQLRIIRTTYFENEETKDTIQVELPAKGILGVGQSIFGEIQKTAEEKFEIASPILKQIQAQYLQKLSGRFDKINLEQIKTLELHEPGHAKYFRRGVTAGGQEALEEYLAFLDVEMYQDLIQALDAEWIASLEAEIQAVLDEDLETHFNEALNAYTDHLEEIYQEQNITEDEYKLYFNTGYLSSQLITHQIIGGVFLKTFQKLKPESKRYIQSRMDHAQVTKEKFKPSAKTKLNSKAQPDDLSRLPRNHGEWKGVEGESKWISHKPAVLKVTRGKPIRFRKERPDFSPWSKGSYSFKEGVLKGTHEDFSVVKDKIKQQHGFASKVKVEEWLEKEKLTIHHVDRWEVELIPSDLHNNIPHVGGAAEARLLGM